MAKAFKRRYYFPLVGFHLVNRQPIQILCADGFSLKGIVFPGRGDFGKVAVVASAMGIPQGFYSGFADYLAGQGFTAVTFDYRGIGDSKDPSLPGSKILFQDWGVLDIDAVLAWSAESFPGKKILLVAHSMGGQLAGLAPCCKIMDGMLMVASPKGYWRSWPFFLLPRMWVIYNVLLPLFTRSREYVPTRKWGWMVDLPTGVSRQIKQWVKTPDFLFDPVHGLDTSRYAELEIPLLAYGFSDDRFLGPRKPLEALLKHYSRADITFRFVQRSRLGRGKIGHLGFFQERFRDPFWRETAEWLGNTK